MPWAAGTAVMPAPSLGGLTRGRDVAGGDLVVVVDEGRRGGADVARPGDRGGGRITGAGGASRRGGGRGRDRRSDRDRAQGHRDPRETCTGRPLGGAAAQILKHLELQSLSGHVSL